MKHESSFSLIMRRFMRHKLAVVSLIVLTLIILAALLAPVIAPYSPTKVTGGFSAPPDKDHWLGTDQIGRDMLSRILYATRISLLVGFLATIISTAIGVVLGLVSGYFGGWLDEVMMRIIDTLFAFPSILLALVVISLLDSGKYQVILALGIAFVPSFARASS